MVSRNNNQPMEVTRTIYCPGWRVGKEEEEEEKKGKSDFSSLSFGAATMGFGLTATQQSTHWDTATQAIFLCGLMHGKGEGREGKISLLLLILLGGRKQRRPGRSRIRTAIRDMDGKIQQATRGGTTLHMNNLDARVRRKRRRRRRRHISPPPLSILQALQQKPPALRT